MLAYILILLGFAVRLLPNVPNFAPVAAIALFAGAYLDRKVALWVPLGIMVVTDMIIGMHDVIFFTWGAFLLIGLIGMFIKGKVTFPNVFGMSVFSALLFFAVSNFGVWLLWYPKDPAGFLNCYLMAIPFFRATIVSNVVFSLALFGAYEAARKFAGESKYKPVLLLREDT